ncbi:MAG: hypothetical protein RLZZ387_2178 [Chloroflexota bacterium]|jgi:uncharacterized cofD-like protein
MDALHIVAIGGGGGASQVLRACAPLASRLTGVIAVTDTGRSTGLARRIGGIPAPGDIRSTIAAFAGDPLMAELLNHRFDGAGVPQLEGMAFGNLLIAALARVTGDFGAAVEHAARLAGCEAEVLPVSTADAQLCAELEGGALVEGELEVRGLGKPPIARLFLREPAPAHPNALRAIREADLVALGPGSLFTTVLACLAFDGVAEALRDARGTVVYICNTTTQPGQTDGYRAADHVRRIVERLGPGALDAALVNRSEPDAAALDSYAAQGLHFLRPDDAEVAEIAALGVRPAVRALTEQVGGVRQMWNKQDTVRHDTALLGAALRDLATGR